MRGRVLFVTALISLSSYSVLADVRSEQKSQVQFAGALGRVFNLFGGKSAREGITSTVVVKGNRKVTSTGNTSQIVDLSEEKIYDLDLKKKSYKVTTFAELRLRMEEARRKAAEDARKQEAQSKPAEAPSNEKEVEVDFDLKSTGQSKTINGFDTSESIMTITVREKGKTLEEGGGLVMTSDMWLAPHQPAMKEVAEFDRRYAEKLYSGVSGMSADQMAMAVAFYPMLRQAASRMAAEGSKIKGTPIATTVTFDAVKSAEQMTGEAKQGQPESKPSGGLGGMLGGLAKKARKNEDDKPQQRTTFMTTNLEVLNLSTDVAAEAVAVPAGFKESN